MNEQRQLIKIGYWHNVHTQGFPDPGSFVDNGWDKKEREKIFQYLRSGLRMPYACGGTSWCRFRCGISHLGSGEQTDGTYIWPEGLAHYVEMHGVRLPDEVRDFMLSK